MNERASGILLHPSSLPSRGGIGDLGPAAYEFLDFLSAARQTLWQILPLGPVGLGNSPYSSISAFAGNPLLISLDRLADAGWIDRGRLAVLPTDEGAVDYDRVRAIKMPLLREAATNFLNSASGAARSRYEKFCSENAGWLDDYVVFVRLRDRFPNGTWNQWPRELARREPGAMARVREELGHALDVSRVTQFAFFEQWRALHQAARQRGIRVIGDVAIFVDYDSADVWTHPDIFQLDDNLNPTVVSGVPPDAFSATGQRWGNPLYRWDALKSRGYDWWVQRMRWALQLCDIVRLDHFRGFESYWEIPAQEPTAVHGRWVHGPNDDLFHVLRTALGGFPFIAEDLGMITPEVHAFRDRLDVPGMKVLQFGFSNPGAHIYLPHRYEENCVVYTGTHDNDTTLGWFNSTQGEERRLAEAYVGTDPAGMPWAFIRAAITSPARLAVIPLQDVLGLGSEARMNVPSRGDCNWTWRYRAGDLKQEHAERLARLSQISDRNCAASAADQQRDREVSENFAA
ncbi:MAG: 4-alpha-glucanotransferase [Terriglobales bacterium]